MDVLFYAMAGLLFVTGVVGCVVPVLPGPFLAYCGLLCLLPTPAAPSTFALVLFGTLILTVTVLDYAFPAIGAKRFHCSRWGTWGCVVGTVVGVFFLPFGLLGGPFAGAVIGELIARKRFGAAVWGGLGSLLGFLSGLAVKTVACLVITAYGVMRMVAR